jgi:hypothetical protein
VEKIVYIFLQDLSKRKHCLCRCPADFSWEKNYEILRTLRLTHDGVSFDKIIPKQVILGQELTENNLIK